MCNTIIEHIMSQSINKPNNKSIMLINAKSITKLINNIKKHNEQIEKTINNLINKRTKTNMGKQTKTQKTNQTRYTYINKQIQKPIHKSQNKCTIQTNQ